MKTTMHLTETTLINLSTQLNEPEWLINVRRAAFKKFVDLPMPSFRYGTDIQLNATELDLSTLNPMGDISLNENNTLAPAEKITVVTFHDALKTHPELVQNHFMKCIAAEDKLLALHYAFFTHGVVIHVPKNVHAMYTFETPQRSTTDLGHILIILEPNSSLNLVQEIYSKYSNGKHDTKAYRSEVVEVFAKENAQLHFGSVQLLNKKTFNLIARRALAEKDAQIEWLELGLGGSFTRAEVSTWLNGTGATSYNYGVFFGQAHQQFDILAAAKHSASNTTCDMFTKGVLTDQSKLVYRGLIKIEENAVHCNGYQKEDTLLLSEEAQADSIPELEINNNDVRCTHGATIGQIDAEKLFYLRSRGLSEGLAKQKMVEGFFEPLIKRLSLTGIQDKVRSLIAEQIHLT